jgi:predicted negative regulator of RcsB-dependent stress response
MAWAEFRSGNTDDALHLLQSAFEAGQDAEVAAHLGEVLWTKGQLQEAHTIWEQGLKINPRNETLRETMKRFHHQP